MTDAETTKARFAATAERLAALGASRIESTRRRVVEVAGPKGGEVALDAACGTGTLALALAPLVSRVVAVDLVPEMLDHGRRQAESPDAIEWLEGDVYALPVDDAAFDLAAIMRTLHHLERPGDALLELARATAPGGRVLVIDQLASEEPAEAALFERIERLRDPSHARTLPDSEVRQLLAAAGLEVDRAEVFTEDRELETFLDLAGCAEDVRVEVRRVAREACAERRTAGVDLRAQGDSFAFTERVGWYVATRAS